MAFSPSLPILPYCLMILCPMQLMQARVMANLTCDVNVNEKCHCILICQCITMLCIIMFNIML